MEAVRPLWESLAQQDRVKMLTVELQTLRERAKQLNEATKQQAGESSTQQERQHLSERRARDGKGPAADLRACTAGGETALRAGRRRSRAGWRDLCRPHTVVLPALAVVDVDSEQLDMLAMGLGPTLEEVLDEGIRRLRERGSTWKLWNWPGEGKDFIDAEAFRQFYTDKHIREELRKFLPRDDPKLPERPAEEGFRKRM